MPGPPEGTYQSSEGLPLPVLYALLEAAVEAASNAWQKLSNLSLGTTNNLLTCYHLLSRLDSGPLLQRYNPVPDSQGSATLHRSASLFSGYSAANRDNYLSVAVKFVSSTKDLVTVRIQKKADVNPVVDP